MGQIYNIPAAYGFADSLVRGLLDKGGDDPLILAATHIYLPTRRAVRTLQLAFAGAAAGRPRLLPHLHALGDVDAHEMALAGAAPYDQFAADLPPAMPTAQRLFLLAQLIDHSWAGVLGSQTPKSNHQVMAYARALMTLLDTVETEGLDLSVLSQAAPTDPDLEGFWERAGRFISLIQDLWPGIEQGTGSLSAATRRRLLLEAQGQAWRENPPDHPVILAGTTATIPAVAGLAKVIYDLPGGQIVLPGLDIHLDPGAMDAVRGSPGHPQYGLLQLLDRLGTQPTMVAPWPGCRFDLLPDRHAALSQAQAPVGWQAPIPPGGYDLDGLALAEAQSPEQEARTIAVFLRAALEDPKATAGLITPDRDLAGRVAAELRRWGIRVDDSAGASLAASTPGRLVQASARLLGPQMRSLDLLTTLWHPHVDLGQGPVAVREFATGLDLALRGLQHFDDLPPDDWPDGAAATAPAQTLHQFRLHAPEGPQSLSFWVDRHLALLDLLGAGQGALWQGVAAEGLARLLETLSVQGLILPPMSASDYADILAGFLAEETYRQGQDTHPRLMILGTLEARLVHLDAVALGGLNEGTWPKETEVGPWMNRPTRAAVGLPSPERKVGLAAHDLAQALGADRVLMTRTARLDGTPTLPCRWIERLKTGLKKTGQAGVLEAAGRPYLKWAQGLDQPAGSPPIQAPAQACPPQAARPKTLQATDIGLLVTNPYGFYAKRILRLRALKPRGLENLEQIWGVLVHEVLEVAVKHGLQNLEAVQDLGQQHLQALPLDPATAALWQVQLAHCLAQFWRLNQGLLHASNQVEANGQMHIGNHQVRGRADRLVLDPAGALIIDYKTGSPATRADQVSGKDPQLSILGLIAASGGFDEVPKDLEIRQAFWDLPKRASDLALERPSDAATRATVFDGLQILLAAYDTSDQPYVCAPFGDSVGRADPAYDDYAHLARRVLT